MSILTPRVRGRRSLVEAPLQTPAAMGDGITANANGTAWAWTTIPTRSTDEVNTSELFRLTDLAANELVSCCPPGAQFHVKVQWSRWSGQDHVDTELAAVGPHARDGQRDLIAVSGERIDQLASPRRQVLFGLRVDEESSSGSVDAWRQRIGTRAEEAAAAEALQRRVKRAAAWRSRMAGSSLSAATATVHELSWALRRDLRRTVDWLPTSSVVSRGQIARLRGGRVTPYADHLRIDTDAGTRYLRCLVPSVTGFPAVDLALPGGEWLQHLIFRTEDGGPFPVEVSIRGRILSARDAAKRLRDALSLCKEQGREAAKGHAEEAPEDISESREALSGRLAELSNRQVVMVTDTPTWLVEADDLDTLNDRTAAVTDAYAGMGIELWGGRHNQDALWMSTVLGDTQRTAEFEQLRPLQTLTGSWFHGGSRVGEDTGPYVGLNVGSTPGPYRSRLSNATRDGDPGTTVMVGRSGAGKSTAVCLHLLGEAVYGAWTLLTDFKGDLHGITDIARRYGVRVTEVSNLDVDAGLMCPFRYVTDPIEAASMSTDLLLMLIHPSLAADAETRIRRAATEVATRDRDSYGPPSTAAVIELLHDSNQPEDCSLGAALADTALDPLARPFAGPRQEHAGDLPTGAGLVYLRLNLDLPEAGHPPEQWRPRGRMSMAAVKAVFMYCAYLSGRVHGIAKVLALTELHLLTPHQMGRTMIGSAARVGRALDTSVLLDTQACVELTSIDGLADQISTVYAFRVKTLDEATAQAALLELDPEPRTLQRQKSLPSGQCLVLDRWGRIAPVQFDYITDDIATALNTNPERDTGPDGEVAATTDASTDPALGDDQDDRAVVAGGGPPRARLVKIGADQ